MKKKSKNILIVSIIILLLGIYFEVKYLLNGNSKEYNETEKLPVYLEEENIEMSIEKFNAVISNNGLSTQINKDNYIIKDNVYHYTIYEDINLYIKPREYIGDLVREITYDLGIYYSKDSEYEGKAKIFLKLLIKANNSDLSDEEIEDLLNEAVKASKEDKDINQNTGISVRYFSATENNNYKEFVIRRHYKYE